MRTLKINIKLLADAEIGTGMGSDTLDDVVPRDTRGNPIIPASHLKGLLREQLEMLAANSPQLRQLSDLLLGKPGLDGTDGQPGLLSLQDARLAPTVSQLKSNILTISRTALNDAGTASNMSLRTVEAIAAGSRFVSTARVDAAQDEWPDILARLGFMAIRAVGGGRTRGAGQCLLEIESETRTPGDLLKKLGELLKNSQGSDFCTRPARRVSETPSQLLDNAAWCKLSFKALGPICCPETPINGSTNHIRSGPVIPASAVQGAIITRLAAEDPDLAQACFDSACFRAWPLIPVLPLAPDSAPDASDISVFGVRVDLTHRMSKLANAQGLHEFRDTALEEYLWSDVAGGSPLKSSDGVLRRAQDGTIDLWRAVDFPRMITGHSVHHQLGEKKQRGLFSVEALAPMLFSGLVALPEEAAKKLKELLEVDPVVCFGKSRTVRGAGKLTIEIKDAASVTGPWQLDPDEVTGKVWIVQSPLALPDDMEVTRAESALKDLAEKAGWGNVVMDSERVGVLARTAATCGVRFGWNRHGLGQRAKKEHNRLRAKRVILPGSVLVLENALDQVEHRLLQGLGDGREQGFGALLPHPGLASRLYQPESGKGEEKKSDQAASRALELFEKGRGGKGPTPSQIAALSRELAKSKEQALEYLKRQTLRGAVKHWQRWEPIIGKVEGLINENQPEMTKKVLRTWQDIAIVNRQDS